MIIVDIESSGLDPKEACMLSLGAVDDESGEEFYEESSLYVTSTVSEEALRINGFKLEDIQPDKKQPAHMLYWEFLDWSMQFKDKTLGGQGIGHFDVLFLEEYHKMIPSDIKWPFGYRSLDLHSVAFAVFRQSLSHKAICERLGILPEPIPHHALEGARSERKAFKELFRQLDITTDSASKYLASIQADKPFETNFPNVSFST